MVQTYYNLEGQIINVIKVNLKNYIGVRPYIQGLTNSINIKSKSTHKQGDSFENDIHAVTVTSYIEDTNQVITLVGDEECIILHNTNDNIFGIVPQETIDKMTLRPQHYLMQLFAYKHLPLHLQAISKPICELAVHLDITLPNNPEKTNALRKLREAKDCAVTAVLFK